MNNLNLPDPKMMDVAVPSNLNLGIDFNRQKVNNGIEPEEFNKIKKDPDSLLIDLREDIEIEKEGKLKNSIIVPFPKMNEYIDKNKDMLKSKKILFYCAHGHRSTLAVQISKSYNYSNCYHLIGGLKNWKKEGLEL
jgi:rhodanese-related sulfurtransferase